MTIVVKVEKGRKRQPFRHGHKLSVEGIEKSRQFLSDNNLFIDWARRFVPVPRTVVVLKGMKAPSFHLKYPLVVKPSHGLEVFACRTQKELVSAFRTMKGAYQIQESLQGFSFIHLYCFNGSITLRKQCTDLRSLSEVELSIRDDEYKIARGVSRRLVDVILCLGIKNFKLVVAVRQQTAYIVSCQPDCGQISK